MFGEKETTEEETAREPSAITKKFLKARGQILHGLRREVSEEGDELAAGPEMGQVKPLFDVKETYHRARDEAIFMKSSVVEPFANMDADGRASLMKAIRDDQAPSLRNVRRGLRRDSLASLRSIEQQLKGHRLIPSGSKRSVASRATSAASDSTDGDNSDPFVGSTRKQMLLRSRLTSIDESKQDVGTDCSVPSGGTYRSVRNLPSSFVVTTLALDPSKRLSTLSELSDSCSVGDWSFANQSLSSRNIMGDDMLNYSTNKKL